MSATELALTVIKPFESCRLVAYLCPAGVWTIGWGSTGPDIGPGLVWSQEEADSRLLADVEHFERGVRKLVKERMSDRQLGALISFAYNVGLKALAGSTLLRLLNIGDFAGASAQFMRWDKAKGKRLRGLTRRRETERALFNGR